MVFIQGAGRRTSPARRCLEYVATRHVQLGLSDAVLAELADVMTRSRVLMRFPNLQSRTATELLDAAKTLAVYVPNPPKAISLPRDPNDEPYLDLAVAIDAAYLVTWNQRHLTYLMHEDDPEAVQFRTEHPRLKIIDPPGFLRAVEQAYG